jgi:hypothetical protein
MSRRYAVTAAPKAICSNAVTNLAVAVIVAGFPRATNVGWSNGNTWAVATSQQNLGSVPWLQTLHRNLPSLNGHWFICEIKSSLGAVRGDMRNVAAR